MQSIRVSPRSRERLAARLAASDRRLKSRGPLGHLCRLVSFLDALYYVGDFLYRRSLRYSVATAAVSLIGYLGNLIPGVETFPARVAIALPLAVGGSTLLGGLVLKNIPNLFFTRLTNVAEAADLDLMEDYRKSQEDRHLGALWDRVYRHEWAIGSTLTRVRPDPLECPPEVISEPDLPQEPAARARAQFFRRARFALARAQSQPRQRYHLGVDLRFLEDWRNGGYFDRNDVKLNEQWEASATLEAVKRAVGYGRWEHLRHLPTRIAQKFWTLMITRAIGVQVGEALTELNRRYRTDYFNAQSLLWPGEEDAPWLEQFPGARADLLRQRRKLLTRIFGEDLYDARRMLERMVLPGFLAATSLRARFDPEYLDGTLGYTALSDLATIGMEPNRLERYRALARRAVVDRDSVLEFLRATRPELLEPENAESLRAVRIAVHVNRRGLRELVGQFVGQPETRDQAALRAPQVVEQAVCDKELASRLLVGLRVHHELARLHHAGYLELLESLYST